MDGTAAELMLPWTQSIPDLSHSWAGVLALVLFVAAYALVASEDLTGLRKSKPVMLAAGLLWVLVAIAGGPEMDIETRIERHLSDFGAVFLFLLSAMTFIATVSERNVFKWLNCWLASAGYGLRWVFWVTGLLAFLLSPVADNLTTAMVMGSVVCAVGAGNPRFVALACINVVVGANAGGAFSPFGDITTLMVWQAREVQTTQFLELFPAAVVNWLVPAAIMSLAIPNTPTTSSSQAVALRRGWWIVILLFGCTIALAVTFHAVLGLPPFLGMTTGLSLLLIYGYIRRMRQHKTPEDPIDTFENIASVEWDTMLFFFGVIMCVGALEEFGYLARASALSYGELGPTWANILVGILSAIVDNVPVMFGVLGMHPEMDVGQWLLVTLTAGVGGSLLSIGSAAGVGLMGVARGQYTFTAHLRWAPVVALGYAVSIAVHLFCQHYLFGR